MGSNIDTYLRSGYLIIFKCVARATEVEEKAGYCVIARSVGDEGVVNTAVKPKTVSIVVYSIGGEVVVMAISEHKTVT